MFQATVTLFQTDPGPDPATNPDQALDLIADAACAGTAWVCLPETFNCRGRHDAKITAAEDVPGELTEVLGTASSTHSIWFFAGSLDERSPDSTKI